MATSYSLVGTQFNHYGFLDSAGYFIGTGLSLANAANSGAGILKGVDNLALALPPARNVVIEGDNTVQGAVLIPGNAAPSGNIVTSVRNPTMINGSIGVLTETVGNTDMDIFGIPCPNYTPLTIVSSAPGINQTPGSQGLPGYGTTIWNSVKMQPLEETAVANATAHQFTHNVLATLTSIKPWGASISVANNGSSSALGIRFFASYPANMHAFRGDGIITTLTLDETPAGTDGNNVMVWDNGTLLVYGAGAGKYTVSGSIITFGTAPVAGHKVQVLYFYLPTC